MSLQYIGLCPGPSRACLPIMSSWTTPSADSNQAGGGPQPPTNGVPPPPQGDGGNSSNGDMDMTSDDLSNDAEGVWSPDIEQSFQEALAIYPPCGRRKIILSDEGKMYGRNELIARYIKLRTGKSRSRKQVSSHIQVLSKRKMKDCQSQVKDVAAKDKVLQSMAAMSSAQIVSASAMHNKAVASGLAGLPPGMGPTYSPYGSQFCYPPSLNQDIKPGYNAGYSLEKAGEVAPPVWQGRSIAGTKLRLVEFSAFREHQTDTESYQKHLFVHIGAAVSYSDPLLEAIDVRQIYDKFPERKGGLKELYEKGPQSSFFLVKFWADLNTTVLDDSGAFYGVTSQYEGNENIPINCSTKVCSFGKQVVEKVETEYAHFEGGRYNYRINRSPMCEYLTNFINKLKHLPEKYMMNSVLENFTILQVVTNKDTEEMLLCIAYVFEVSTSEHGTQHHIYRLVKD